MATDRKRPSSRLNLEVGPKSMERLERMSKETEQSLSEVIRSALALYDTIWTELKAGRKLIIQDSEGDKEIILPSLRS